METQEKNNGIKSFGVEDYEGYWKSRQARNRTYKTDIHRILIQAIHDFAPKGGKVLDIGVGPGHVFKELLSDYDCHGIEFAEEAFKLYDFPSQQIVKHDVTTGMPPFDGIKPFDALIASHVIHHFRDPIGFLRSCLGVMSDTSIFVIATPNTTFFPLRLRYFFKGEFPNLSPGHINFMTPKEYAAAFAQVGLEVVEVRTMGRHTLLQRLSPTLFSGTLFYICKKKR